MTIENAELSDRGFKGGKFTDRYGEQCSISESSICAVEGDGEGWCIWLGVDKPICTQLIPGKGWTDVPIPEDALHTGRMHLSQRQVGELIPHLQYFVETGYLPTPEQHDEFVKHLDDNRVQDIINDFFSEVSN